MIQWRQRKYALDGFKLLFSLTKMFGHQSLRVQIFCERNGSYKLKVINYSAQLTVQFTVTEHAHHNYHTISDDKNYT